jgi:hypothetical protein
MAIDNPAPRTRRGALFAASAVATGRVAQTLIARLPFGRGAVDPERTELASLSAAPPLGRHWTRLVERAEAFLTTETANPVSPFAHAQQATSAGNPTEAVAIAIEAVGSERGPMRGVARAVFAAAIALSDREAAAELFTPRAGFDSAARNAASSALLYASLAKPTANWEEALLLQLFERCPPEARVGVLRSRLALAQRSGADKAALSGLIAGVLGSAGDDLICFRSAGELLWALDAHDLIEPLLERYPRFDEGQATQGLLAALEARAGCGRMLSDEGRAQAERFARVEDASRAFWGRLCEPHASVAVVGNSPCETGRGLGPAIDAHAAVLRFNHAPETGPFEQDYGRRTDAKFYKTATYIADKTRTGAPFVGARQLTAVRQNLAHVEKLNAKGKTVVWLSAPGTMALCRELGRQPSAGLAVLDELRRRRGSLDGVSVYGFSLTDQIAPNGEQPRYFNTKRPGNHDWRKERAFFDAWTARA